ncbi:MAG TPA: molybdopterin cofactor-binding domain-containing protein [Bryobacteraceae bacterium]|nr:molybdopterin cofactor-binding domain-containing protein [Bryobacteraceae bacterium]
MITRRDFFATVGGGIVVFLIPDGCDAQESGGGRRRGFNQRLPEQISAWMHIAEDGTVTVYTGKVEVGQNSRTSLSMAVAEELRAPLSSIHMVMGDTTLTPFDMGTFGSRTTPTMWPQLRKVAATAREALMDLAAKQWKADRTALKVESGKVLWNSHSASFGELTKGQKLAMNVSSSAPLTPATEWRVAGKPTLKVSAHEIVTGRHKYPYDIQRPGMLYGKVLYPPAFGAKLASFDASAAKAIHGVTVVHEGDFVAIAAPEPDAADRALAALKAEWTPAPPQPSSSSDMASYYENNAEGGLSPKAAQSYNIAYIAHVPLEPRAAVAEWSGDKVTVWTGSQRPFGVRSELASHFSIPETSVHVMMPDTGAAYGGKHTGDAALEAARIAKVAGRPVRRGWTRQEEMTWAYFRPGGVIKASATVSADGIIQTWSFDNYNSGPSGLNSPYHVPQGNEHFHRSKAALREGSYRGLAATANHFARESYMDELAHSVSMDPLEFRLKNTTDERLRNVIQAAADRFGWKDHKKTAGHGFGIAAGFEKGGYIATCAEVRVERPGGAVKVLRVVESFECGAIVNPLQLENQIEGAIMMGLGGALFEQIEFANGKILNDRLARYRVPRFTDMPAIEVVLLDRKDIPSAGAGETPIVGIAPAVANAIFDVTGVRLRSLPLAPKGVNVS